MNAKNNKIYVFHLTDFHYTFNVDDQSKWGDLFNLLLKKIKGIVDKKKINQDEILFMLTGDFYDQNTYDQTSKVFDLMKDFVRELNKLGAVTTTIGNHEVKYKDEDSRNPKFKEYLYSFQEIYLDYFKNSLQKSICSNSCICKKILNGYDIKNKTFIESLNHEEDIIKALREFTKELYYHEKNVRAEFKLVNCDWEKNFSKSEFYTDIIGYARDGLYDFIENKICEIEQDTQIKSLFEEDKTYGLYKHFYSDSLSRINTPDYFIGNIKSKKLLDTTIKILHLNSSLFSLSGDQYNNFTATGVIRASFFKNLIEKFKKESADYKFVVSHYPIGNWNELHEDFIFYKDVLMNNLLQYSHDNDNGGFSILNVTSDRFINLMFFGHTHRSNINIKTISDNKNDQSIENIIVTGSLRALDLKKVTNEELIEIEDDLNFTLIEMSKINGKSNYNRTQYSLRIVEDGVIDFIAINNDF